MAEPRLRIAVLHRIFVASGGGAERYAMALVEHLSKQHDIHVFAQEFGPPLPDVTYHKISTPLCKPRWINQLWYAYATWAATRQGFDIVHSHENTWHGNVQTVHVLPVWHNFFAKRQGVRLLLRHLQAWTSPRMWTYLALESLRFRALSGPRLVVAASDSLREVMAKTFPHSSAMLRVLTPGVDLPDIDNKAARKAQARQQFGIPPGAPCILLVGNDFGKKGLPSLLMALTFLTEETVLLAVGAAQRIPEYRQLASDLGVEERVVFSGPLDNISTAYLCADVLAHPTLEDTFAMVVLEAMAHQLPVLVSSSTYCGIASLLEDGVNAVILPDPQDSTAMAQALSQLLADSAYRQTLAEKGFEFASQHTWATQALAQERMYFELKKSG